MEESFSLRAQDHESHRRNEQRKAEDQQDIDEPSLPERARLRYLIGAVSRADDGLGRCCAHDQGKETRNKESERGSTPECLIEVVIQHLDCCLGQETLRARNHGLEDGLGIIHHEAHKGDSEYQEREQEEDKKVSKLARKSQGVVGQ